MRTHENNGKIATGPEDDGTTGGLLYYNYYYKMVKKKILKNIIRWQQQT